jgi:hypothetical protein
MDEEVKDLNTEGTENLTDEKPENNNKDKQEKVFKQADVDKIVSERVSREKTSYKTLKEEFDSYKADYEEKISTYENVLKGFVETAKQDIPENFRVLFDKLSVIEQYQFLTDDKNKIAKKTIPVTPKSNGDIEKPTKRIGNFI